MEPSRTALPERLLDTLEQLLAIPAGNLQATLTHVSDVVASATASEKVDAFLYDPSRDSLVAVGSSTQPLSMLQRKLGLDVLQISNGGRAVHVFKTGEVFVHGRIDQDDGELLGIKQGLGIRSNLGVPLDIGGRRRGMLMLASRTPEYFTPDDVRFAAAIGRWVGIVTHRAELLEEIGRNAAEAGRRQGAEELVTVVAHDLRNYIGPIAMRAEVLRIRAERSERSEDLADLVAMQRSLGRLGSLVGDILDVARIDGGMFQIATRMLDLGALVRELVAALQSPQNPLQLTIQDGAAIHVAGDAPRLRQCLENVIVNALQKSPAHAAVSVFVTCSRNAEGTTLARVEVIDQGPGIPQDALPRIFERFYSGRKREGGLGMGLYLAKRIAVLHGGDLTVESRAGAGARFSLILPALSAPKDSKTG